MLTIRTDHEKLLENIIETTGNYLKDNTHLKSLIVGLSGGIDSAVTCALARDVLARVPTVTLMGSILPIETNTPQEIDRGENVGRSFCDAFETRDLTKAYRDLYRSFVANSSRAQDTKTEEKIRRGNLKARVRMAYLFDIAHAKKGMVLSTDNYTEFLLGFWTLHGDVGNYGMIQNLWKTEVYSLADHLVDKYKKEGKQDKALALLRCIEAVPTDGLGITSNDFEQIGVADYRSADALLIDYLKGNTNLESHPTIIKHKQTAFKRHDPHSIPRKTLFK
jgi:NAD+ synthetase